MTFFLYSPKWRTPIGRFKEERGDALLQRRGGDRDARMFARCEWCDNDASAAAMDGAELRRLWEGSNDGIILGSKPLTLRAASGTSLLAAGERMYARSTFV
jgi:hypothetical protein